MLKQGNSQHDFVNLLEIKEGNSNVEFAWVYFWAL
jgi:hypothetical protein